MGQRFPLPSSDGPAESPQPEAGRDRTLTSRYECKYLVNPGLVDAIRRYMQPYVRPDRHAIMRPGFRYPISSLYLDSPDLTHYQQTQDGAKQRYKLRIRTYGDEPHQPVFFEVKKRSDGVVYKTRCRLERRVVAEYFDSRADLAGLPPEVSPKLEEFAQKALISNAGPVMRIKYNREAYESVAGDPVRITFDTDLVSSLTYDHDLRHSGHDWLATPLTGTILELKFTDRFPSWVGELVERFELRRCSVAKYVLSMQKALDEGRCRRPILGRGRYVPSSMTA